MNGPARLPAAGVAHGVGETRLLVDRQVVGAGDLGVDGVGLEGGRVGGVDVPEPGHVEDLHAVLARVVRDHQGVIPQHLHVAPGVPPAALGLGELAQIDRLSGVGDIHERGPLRAAYHGVLATGVGVGPAPDVVHHGASGAAQVLHREE